MNLTKEQLEKARQAKSAEGLLALAKENGIELAEEEVKKYFDALNKQGELADEELNNVSGGGCGGSNVPSKVNVNSQNPTCPSCGAMLAFDTNKTGQGLVTTYCHDDAGNYDIYVCIGCGKKYRHHWDGDLWTKN